MLVIADSSPLIAFDYLGELRLLPQVFGSEISIPAAVLRELGARSLPAWIRVRALCQPVHGSLVRSPLGTGETEAISLAMELRADYILLDDRAARRHALALDLNVIGTLGVLVRAKERALISALRPKLDRLRGLPFHMTAALYREVLTSAGEETFR